MFTATPWILAPSSFKILYAAKIKDFWRGLGQFGILNYGLAIIGYSMPIHDDYARQMIFCLVENYQENYYNEPAFKKRKSPVVVVNYAQDGEERTALEKRYRFVDWSKAVLYTKGFDERALELIFAPAAGE